MRLQDASAIETISADSPPSCEPSLARGAWISLLSQIVAAALAYLLQIILARALGTAGFGVYAAAVVWMAPLAVVAGFGLPGVVVRYLPAYRARDDAARLTGFVRAAERIVLGGSVAVAAVGSVVALLAAAEPTPLLVGLWTLPLTVQLRLQTEIARAAGRYEAAFFVPLLQPLAMLAGALLAHELLGGLTPALGLALPGLGVLVVLPWQRAMARGVAPRAVPRYETRTWLSVSLGVLAIDASCLLLSHADAILLGTLRSARAVALFSVASATAGFTTFPMIALGGTVVPAFSRLWARGEKAELERLAQRTVLRAFAAQLGLAAVAMIFARPVLALYGADFAEARLPLVFILGGQLANTGTGYVGSLMTMTGHQAVVGRSIWIAALTNLGLVLVGAHLWGVAGATAGTALSSLGWNLWLYHLVRRHVGVRASFVDAVLAWRGELPPGTRRLDTTRSGTSIVPRPSQPDQVVRAAVVAARGHRHSQGVRALVERNLLTHCLEMAQALEPARDALRDGGIRVVGQAQGGAEDELGERNRDGLRVPARVRAIRGRRRDQDLAADAGAALVDAARVGRIEENAAVVLDQAQRPGVVFPGAHGLLAQPRVVDGVPVHDDLREQLALVPRDLDLEMATGAAALGAAMGQLGRARQLLLQDTVHGPGTPGAGWSGLELGAVTVAQRVQVPNEALVILGRESALELLDIGFEPRSRDGEEI